jgi:hypothetical protein
LVAEIGGEGRCDKVSTPVTSWNTEPTGGNGSPAMLARSAPRRKKTTILTVCFHRLSRTPKPTMTRVTNVA